MFKESLNLTEPFHGPVWIGVTRNRADPNVRLVISIEKGWDVDIFLSLGDAMAIAKALGTSTLQVVTGKTPDGTIAVVMAEDKRLAVSILGERLSDVLVLGHDAVVVRDALTAAAGL